MTDEEQSRIQRLKTESDLWKEVLVDGFEYLREDLHHAASILRGTKHTFDGECNMAGCDNDPIGEYPTQERWKDDHEVCRKHWTILHGSIAVIKVVMVLVLIALLLSPFLLLS